MIEFGVDFSVNGIAETGLSPSITIRDTSDGSVVINGVAVSEVGGGAYKYLFDNDTAKNYRAIIDGGVDTLDSRYMTAWSERAKTEAEIVNILADTNDLQTNQGDFATATGFSIHNAADVKTAMEAAGTKLTEVKTQTDKMNFTGTDVKSTLDGEEVTTDTASRTASKATGFATENPPSQILDDYKADVSALATSTALAIVDGIVDRILKATEIRQCVITDAAATPLSFTTDLTETSNQFWVRAVILITSGVNIGQMRAILHYNGSTKQVMLKTPLDVAPAQNDTFIILTERKYLTPDIEDIIDQSWDASRTDHVIPGTMGEGMQDLHDEALGKWTLDPAAKTLTYYRLDGSVLVAFSLPETTAEIPTFIGRIPI